MEDGFTGTYQSKVDRKGRMSIPAKFRRVIEEGDPEWSSGKPMTAKILYRVHKSDICARGRLKGLFPGILNFCESCGHGDSRFSAHSRPALNDCPKRRNKGYRFGISLAVFMPDMC